MKRAQQTQFDRDMREAALQMAFKHGKNPEDIERVAKNFLKFMQNFINGDTNAKD